MPRPRLSLSDNWIRLLIVLAIAVACAGGAVTGNFRAAEDIYQQARFALSDKPASGQVHVVEMDAASIAAIKEWPWPREHYARLVRQLDDAGVRTIAFDVDFSSRSNLGGDEEFARAVAAAAAPVIVPTFAQSSSYGDSRKLDALPVEALRDHVKLGSVSIAPDPDGFIRRMPMGTITDGSPRPSLAAYVADQSGAVGENFPINYAININSIPRHSFIAIERGEFDPAELRGKDVVVGATAIEMGDRYPVPRYGVVPGVLVQALGAETLLAGRPSYGSWPLPLTIALMIAFAVLQARNRTATIQIAGAGMVTMVVLAHIAQTTFAIWFEIVPAMLAITAAMAVRMIRIARDDFVARRRTDASSGMPNAVAMREDAAVSGQVNIIAGMIEGFDALKAVIGQDDLGHMLNRVVERLEVAGCGKPIYRVDDRVLAWCTSLDMAEIDQSLAGLRAIMRHPVEIGGRRVDVTLHFGIAPLTGPEAIGHAEHAASAALGKGKNWWLHEASQSELLEQQVSLMGELDTAIHEGQIKVYYQPKLDLKLNQITCSEALVRWEHPVRGMLPPDSFIPLAEESGRIEDLTLHVICQAIRDMSSWCERGITLGAAVNISAKLLSAESFVSRAEALIVKMGVPAGRLSFEVTESAELDDPDAAIAALNGFRARGIAISMDDYGTGQSALSYLKQLPISELKIDRAFVQHAHVDHGDAMLVRSTVQLAHELGLKVVAEGIEDAECLEFLRTLDCDYAQGYFIGRPMPADSLLELVTKQAQLAA
ncbi:EAL domain-containing protein [Qipengyuania sp. ASV99]|uniref:EAL domain-containing protein n=1 Tax=Qipengyuania sp. ASV99 TaxID=3399681 RepID=UPI003A4C50FD